MFNYMFKQPYLLPDDGTDIAGDTGETDAQIADVQDVNDDSTGDTGVNDSGAADRNTQDDASFKDNPQNKAFAEIRRKAEKAERDLSIARKYGADYGVYSDEDIAAKFGQSHGIRTLEQLETALLNEQYQKSGIDPSMINNLIENHPTVKNAKEQQLNATVNTQFEELLKEFPDCGFKSVNDMHTMPTYDKFLTKLRQGYSIADAYESCNRAEIRAKQSAAVKQRTFNNINSKQHLKTEGDGANDASDVKIDPDTLQMYLDQGMTKAQAQQYHKKIYG